MNVNSVEEAVKLAVNQAILADMQGTFSVGGLLIDIAGNVIKEMHNNVVKDGLVYDPTAHGERQLVDWYFDNRDRLGLPSPSNLIIVTSLDPCAMCTGAILAAGFRLAIISALDPFAGINYNAKADFPTFNGFENLKIRVAESFVYPKIEGSSRVSRPASGAKNDQDLFPPGKDFIKERTGMLSATVFESTLEKVQETINQDIIPESGLKDLSKEPSSWVYQEVKSRFPDAFEYRAPSPQEPDEGLAKFIDAASVQDTKNGGDGNCVVFLDYFGNLIFCASGLESRSPIQTAFMRATRMYAELRYDIAKRSKEDLKYLCHPKYGTFIYTYRPNVSARSLMNMGAYGSTMEGEIPKRRQLQYIAVKPPYDDLQKLISQMPPFYTDTVKISISQVTNEKLIQHYLILND